MTPQDEPYGASSGLTDCLPWEQSDQSPPPYSESRSGIERADLVARAISSCEFSEGFVGGVSVQRQGNGLKIGYDSAMEMLGFGGGYGDPQQHQ